MWKLAALAGALLAACARPALAHEIHGPPDDLLTQIVAVDEAAIAREARADREARNWERVRPAAIATMVVHALDIVTTIRCGQKDIDCRETRAPGVYGEKPKAWRVLAVKLPIMAGSWILGREAAKRSPAAGYVFYGISGGLTGRDVVGNIRIVF